MVAGPPGVSEHSNGAVAVDDDEVDLAVVIEVARGRPAPNVQGREIFAGRRRDLGERPASTPLKHLRTLRHRNVEPGLLVDVPIGDKEVERAVVIGVQRHGTETGH